jgi:hypothetical protein
VATCRQVQDRKEIMNLDELFHDSIASIKAAGNKVGQLFFLEFDVAPETENYESTYISEIDGHEYPCIRARPKVPERISGHCSAKATCWIDDGTGVTLDTSNYVRADPPTVGGMPRFYTQAFLDLAWKKDAASLEEFREQL